MTNYVGPKSSFGLLDVEGIDDMGDKTEPNEIVKKEKKTRKGKVENKTSEENQDLESKSSNDKVFTEESTVGNDDNTQEVNSDEDEHNFKKEKRKAKKNRTKNEEDEHEKADEEEETTVKTAAQKRAEKKERDKKKKDAQKKKTKETKTEKIEDPANLEELHLRESNKTTGTVKHQCFSTRMVPVWFCRGGGHQLPPKEAP